MFSRAIQPPILSLFSSTSTDCLSLFSVHTDSSLLSDSFVHVLDDESSLPQPTPPKALIRPIMLDDAEGQESDASNSHKFSIGAPVLHIQSPTLRSGYIRCPPTHWRPHAAQRDRDLGIKLGWMHMQVRNMGREWCFEVGVVDQSGKEGRVRCSTFQVRYTISIFAAPHDEGTPFLLETALCSNRAPGVSYSPCPFQIPFPFLASAHRVEHNFPAPSLPYAPVFFPPVGAG